MKGKTLIFILSLVLSLSVSPLHDVLASGSEEVVTETTDTESETETESDIEVVSDTELILDAMKTNQQKLTLIYIELKSISALLLILVGFETMKIVRSWSKGVGLK